MKKQHMILESRNARIDIISTCGTEYDLPRRKGGYFYFHIKTTRLDIHAEGVEAMYNTKRTAKVAAARICRKLGFDYWFWN